MFFFFLETLEIHWFYDDCQESVTLYLGISILVIFKSMQPTIHCTFRNVIGGYFSDDHVSMSILCTDVTISDANFVQKTKLQFFLSTGRTDVQYGNSKSLSDKSFAFSLEVIHSCQT